MSSRKIPATPATRQLKAGAVSFSLHPYAYEEKGGTATAAAALGVSEHCVIKTLVMEDDSQNSFIVLMHGDKQVSVKALARQLGVKTVQPCILQKAEKTTGYVVGGISPFGMRHQIPVYMEVTLSESPVLYINAGKRGLLLSMNPQDLIRLLNPVSVNVAI